MRARQRLEMTEQLEMRPHPLQQLQPLRRPLLQGQLALLARLLCRFTLRAPGQTSLEERALVLRERQLGLRRPTLELRQAPAAEQVARVAPGGAPLGRPSSKQALHPQNADAVTLSKHGEARGGMIPRLRAVSHEEEQSRFDSGAFTFDAPDFADDDTAPQPELTAARPQHQPQQPPSPASSPAVARAAIKRADEPAPPSGETADLLEALRRRRGERPACSPLE